jgi:hypothetical protein
MNRWRCADYLQLTCELSLLTQFASKLMCQRASVGMLVNRSINAIDSACWLSSCSGLHTLLVCCSPRIADTSWHL